MPSALKVASHDNCYKVPEISALEQLNVDTQNDEYQIISAGARVMALWGTDYYAAYVCGYILITYELISSEFEF